QTMSSIGDAFEELGELDLNNIGSWPLWAHVVAIVLVAAVIIGAGSWYFVLPRQDQLEHLQQQELTLKQTFVTRHAKVASFDAYKQQLATIREHFGHKLDKLPKRSE